MDTLHLQWPPVAARTLVLVLICVAGDAAALAQGQAGNPQESAEAEAAKHQLEEVLYLLSKGDASQDDAKLAGAAYVRAGGALARIQGRRFVKKSESTHEIDESMAQFGRLLQSFVQGKASEQDVKRAADSHILLTVRSRSEDRGKNNLAKKKLDELTTCASVALKLRQEDLHELALPYMLRALKIALDDPVQDPDDHEMRHTLVNFDMFSSRYLPRLGYFREAKQALESALFQLQRIDEEHKDIGAPPGPQLDRIRIHARLAEVAAELGDMAAAHDHLATAVAETTGLGEMKVDVVPLSRPASEVNAAAGLIHAVEGRWDEAAYAVDRVMKTFQFVNFDMASKAVNVGKTPYSDSLNDFELFGQEGFRGTALNLGVKWSQVPTIAAMSAEWILNAKGREFDAKAALAQKFRSMDDPKELEVLDQIGRYRADIAALALGASGADKDASIRFLLSLYDLEGLPHGFPNALKYDYSPIKPIAGSETEPRPSHLSWAKVDRVRAAIPADGRLIEVARFHPRKLDGARSTGGAFGPPRYVAWVIPPTGAETIKVVDLGPAAAIDKAIAQVHAAISPDLEDLRALGELEVEKGPIRQRLWALSLLVLRPLLPHLEGVDRWIISADGQLWLAPWAALLLSDGHYAVESHTIRLVKSGRDLLAKPEGGAGGPPIVFADPDFGPAPAALGDSDRSRFASKPIGRLPGTAAEAEAIAPSLRAYTQLEPVLLIGAAATEKALRSVRSPRVLVLSTHGFALTTPELQPHNGTLKYEKNEFLVEGKWARSESGYINPPLPVDPLVRCGLVLSGANARLGPARRPAQDDGLVTGFEIELLDLSGTDMVVLSACDTGLGEVHDGEGVAGLRQAFLNAGAKAVVAALWQVPDKESARLMDDFFRRLATGARGEDALRDAQRALIKSLRERGGAALPFYWAAFTFTGL